MKRLHISQKLIKKHLAYDPDTGVFTKLIGDKTGRFPAGFEYKPKTWDAYMHIRVAGRSYAAHRLAWVYMTGKQPNIVDHENGLRHDNRFTNLRNGTFVDNAANRKRHRIANGSYIPHPDSQGEQ